MLPLLLAVSLLAGAPLSPALSQQLTQQLSQQPLTRVPLRCRLDGGPWRDCLMVVERMGEAWQLLLGSEQFGFQHDGSGQVQMRRGQAPWLPVQARWTADAALCWDGICAQGNIPLD
ncbi:MAG: hypothetical protein K0U63_00795 [Cyanobacteria bacterium]|nr:hypothetical protein [Cyanobacteriota bacterium]